jgi:outer membrane scaffolding protein for murein synthesis (MipA/OmpV family)
MNLNRRCHRLLLAAAALSALCGTACAEGPIEPGPDVDAGLNPGVKKPLWELGVGVAGLRLPDYRGSDQSRSYLLPLPYIVYRGTWLKADRDGARALLLDTQRVKVDVSVAASTPTRSKDNAARAGMPNLPAVGEIGPNLNYTLAGSAANHWRLDLRLPLRAAVTLQRSPQFIGTTFSPHLNLDLGGVAGGWNVGMLTGPLFADRKYHEHFYGVDAAYATPQRPAYQAHGGYAGWQALAATSRRFGNTWVGAFVRYDSLHGAAFEDSPLVRRNSALTFGFGISWILATSSELVPASD